MVAPGKAVPRSDPAPGKTMLERAQAAGIISYRARALAESRGPAVAAKAEADLEYLQAQLEPRLRYPTPFDGSVMLELATLPSSPFADRHHIASGGTTVRRGLRCPACVLRDHQPGLARV